MREFDSPRQEPFKTIWNRHGLYIEVDGRRPRSDFENPDEIVDIDWEGILRIRARFTDREREPFPIDQSFR